MERIQIGHGSGGRLTQDLIKGVFLKHLLSPALNELTDAARIKIGNKSFAFTTDSYVVKPLFFPGGDIGSLSVFGTVNDLLMMGARPQAVSLGLIIEEGFPINLLNKITASASRAAKQAEVEIVAADTKVVGKNEADKIFINTSGIGEIIKGIRLSAKSIRPSDKIIINGPVGDHGLAILGQRQELNFDFRIKSDSAPLNNLVLGLLGKMRRDSGAIKFMRDPTRGGLATVLNEIAQSTDLGIILDENSIPVNKSVRAACNILGLDPLYIANEGKVVLVIDKNYVNMALDIMKRLPDGKDSCIIGELNKRYKGKAILNTCVGGERILDMLTSDPIPRIC
ncbi:MAG: hydrogenase expression/formation protein HypE [Candidatus Omnitrophota bacterium]